MYWANFLHIYQPPTQKLSILKKAADESYFKIIEGLAANPKAKVTLNINAVLTEMLVNNGYEGLVNKIKILSEKGQIELTGSAKFHPFLPKLPQEEIFRQIKLNHLTNRKYFGKTYQPRGFFSPEMGFNSKIREVAKKLGFEWIILDEIACPDEIDHSKIYQDASGMIFFFRERETSSKILFAQLGTAESLIRELLPRLDKDEYLLTAMDGETFGHHRPGLEKLLLEIYQEPRLPTVTISELPKLFPEIKTVSPRESTWSLTKEQLSKNIPFSLWDNPKNAIHKKQWQLVRLAIKTVKKDGQMKPRHLLDRSLHSDQFWWASTRPWWSLEMIERGAFELKEAVKACGEQYQEEKRKAEEIYSEIIKTAFNWQRTGKVEDLSRKEDEETKGRLSADKQILFKEDYREMIKVLRSQMLILAKDEEYTRADQFKKRIEELTADMEKATEN